MSRASMPTRPAHLPKRYSLCARICSRQCRSSQAQQWRTYFSPPRSDRFGPSANPRASARRTTTRPPEPAIFRRVSPRCVSSACACGDRISSNALKQEFHSGGKKSAEFPARKQCGCYGHQEHSIKERVQRRRGKHVPWDGDRRVEIRGRQRVRIVELVEIGKDHA